MTAIITLNSAMIVTKFIVWIATLSQNVILLIVVLFSVVTRSYVRTVLLRAIRLLNVASVSVIFAIVSMARMHGCDQEIYFNCEGCSKYFCVRCVQNESHSTNEYRCDRCEGEKPFCGDCRDAGLIECKNIYCDGEFCGECNEHRVVNAAMQECCERCKFKFDYYLRD
jgi:hypothetical protein